MVSVSAVEIPAPEPDLEPEELVARARALVPAVRAQQEEAERLGHHTEELQRQFVRAGFYRILQPRRFGGYEFGLPVFWRVMLEVASGDPGTGWGLTLGAHHALVVGAHFGEEGQREIFGPEGDFRGPHRPAPTGQAVPVDGGYLVSGTWSYCSGVTYATHFIGNAVVPGQGGQSPADSLVVVIPRDEFTVLDDWGDGATLGMNSSGSNSVRVEEVFVPERRTSWNWGRADGPTPGARLHGNPMYLGRTSAVYHAGLVIPLIGAARASLAEYEQIIKSKTTMRPPGMPQYTHPDYQRAYGHALSLADAAEALVLRVGEQYMELCERWARTGEPFTREDDVRMYAVLQHAGQMAVQAVVAVFSAAGSSPAKRGQRMQRYYRDMSMYHGHIAAQHLSTSADLARLCFGLPDNLP